MEANPTDQQSDVIVQMRRLLREKILRVVHSLENYRCDNYCIITEIQTTMDMMSQLSELTSSCHDTNIDDIIDYFTLGLNAFKEELTSLQLSTDQEEPKPTIIFTGNRGRPSFNIPRYCLEELIECDFKLTEIAKLLSVSVNTVKRRLELYGISARPYSNIGELDLKELIKNFKDKFPDAGYRTVTALLADSGHRVQRCRVQEALKAVDPEGVLFRRLFLNVRRVQRRAYNVRAPRALWHIDGNHKLIRWKFVIHGGIDGYSRLPVFLKVNTNNTAESVLEAFIESVEQWGLPERVRSDKGGENRMVAEFMLVNKGVGSFIAGRSVHNQRIERLWREIWTGCASIFYQLFYYMEDHNILDIDNEIHIRALHIIFKKRIQQHLDKLRHSLTRRPLRTERNRTPLQLWIEGQLIDPVASLNQDDLVYFGIDYDGPVNLECEQVQLEEGNHVPLGDLAVQALNDIQSNESDNFGIDHFQHAVNILVAQ